MRKQRPTPWQRWMRCSAHLLPAMHRPAGEAPPAEDTPPAPDTGSAAVPFEPPAPAPEPEAKPAAAEEKASAPKAESGKQEQRGGPKPTLRVELERVDRLINAVGELIINHSMLAQQIANLNVSDTRDVETELEGFKNLARDIQEGVMAIRAQTGETAVPAHGADCAGSLCGDRQDLQAGHRRREHRGRQDSDRTAVRPADAHPAQRGGPRCRKTGRPGNRRARKKPVKSGCPHRTGPAAFASRSRMTVPV